MRKQRLHLFVLLALSTAAFAEQTVVLSVEGLKRGSEPYNNVQSYLSQLGKDEADGSERYQLRVQEAADKALRALGYYNSEYHFDLTPRPRPQKDRLQLTVRLANPVKLDERDIQIHGELADDSDLQQLLNGVPKAGTILNHSVYDNFKSNVEKIAHANGYFDGEWLYHRLEVYPEEQLADWRLAYDSGVRYRYGKIEFINSQIRENYLRNILRIQENDPYALSDLSKISSDYSASKWFSSVLIEPQIDEQNKTVDLNVLLQPKKKNEMEVGIGYATDVGARLQLDWRRPWINSRGHSLETKSFVSKPEQTVEVGYNIPVKARPLQYYYQISGGLEREDQNDTHTTAANFAFQRFWSRETGWALSLGIKTRYDAFRQGSDDFHTLLVYPTASLNRTRSDGNRFPLWGDSQKLTVNVGRTGIGSDVNFYSLKISSIWLRTYKENYRLYLRGEIGYLKTDDFVRIPPSLRYFAGGDLSVRGFGYKKISPKDNEGNLSGGSHLVTGSLEYQYQVYPNWWAALFYDTGLAANSFQGRSLHSGVGAGVRWASPIGTIKFDLASPVRSPNNQKGVQFYIGIGSEL